jgi:Na+/proline symporter
MLQGSVIVIASLAYLGALFAIAHYGDKRADAGRSIIANPYIYSLSLAVYCTAWTYYGSVGRAVSTGIGFLPIYLGPTLAFALWWIVMLKMIRISKANRVTSIADFVASRYGKSHLLGGLVAIIAVIGIIPYIALQLKAVSNSFTILLHYPDTVMPAWHTAMPVLQDTTLYIALILAAFSILFGTRRLGATESHEGMVAAIAFESLVKLLAFLAVGLFVTFGIYDGFADIFKRAAEVPRLQALMKLREADSVYGNWASLTVLSMLAIMFLPRQFQITVVENVNENHLRKAIWLFPLYLFLINIFVLPIAIGGLLYFPTGGVDADTFVLTLPIAERQEALALFAFLGGLSAATGMVIVETIALSTMVCNDVVMPLLLRQGRQWLIRRADLSGLVLSVRRGAIVGILVLGYVYFRVAGESYALVGIGLISFAAVAQFAPAILGGLFWKGATRTGATAGLVAGFLVWLYTLLLPSFVKSGWLPAEFMEQGLLGIELLKPQQLFGLTGLDEITHCLFWSMFANIGIYLAVSFSGRPSAVETGQAALFVNIFSQTQTAVGSRFWRGSAHVEDLLRLTGRFLGPEGARSAFESYARRRGLSSISGLEADADLVHYAESMLAGAIGSASARVMVASVVKEEPLGIDELMNILEEASEVRAYSRELEEKSRELEEATRDLRQANDRLMAASAELAQAREREFEIGYRIQHTLLLDQPPRDISGLPIAALTIPSHRIDGDFYVFFKHPGQRLDVIVGDVMGKGIPAALLGAGTKSHIIEALCHLTALSTDGKLPEPKEIVTLAHAEVARHLINLESFVTLCYLRLDLDQRNLVLVDCGHTGLIHCHRKTGLCELVHGDNLPLGVREGEIYDQISFPFETGTL